MHKYIYTDAEAFVHAIVPWICVHVGTRDNDASGSLWEGWNGWMSIGVNVSVDTPSRCPF